MKPDQQMEQRLEQLANAIGNRDSFADEVMRRIESSPVQFSKKQKRRIVLRSKLMKNTLRFTAAAVIAVGTFLSLTVLDTTVSEVKANEVLASAIRAVHDVRSIHIRARMRTLPQDNFMYLNLDLDFVPIEMWKKQCDDGQLRMRIDKPLRQIVMDNTQAKMVINHSYVVEGRHGGNYVCFDSDWLSRLLQVDRLLESELRMAQEDARHEVTVFQEDADGRKRLVVKRFSQANVSQDDYLRNKFVQDADRTFIYFFEPDTKLLEGVQMFVHAEKGNVLTFEISDIVYNMEIPDERFTLNLPADAVHYKDPEVLPDNEKYVTMTPKEAARAFFTACEDENWDEFLKFWPIDRVDDRIRQYLGGIEIVSLGEPFQSEGSSATFVPYEIRLKDGQVKKHNIAFKRFAPANRWVVDGGI
jgi:outer membrane lipoprotein-sorting protein